VSSLGKLEKTRPWQLITGLVSDNGGKQPAASRIFCLGNLAEEMSYTRVVVLNGDRVDVSD